MPTPGSKKYDLQKHKMEKDFADKGVRDDVAEAHADEAMKERGDEHADARRSGGGARQGTPWPREPKPTTSGE